MANTRMINGEAHVLQGNGLYRQLAGDEGKPKYFVDGDGKAFEALEDLRTDIDKMVAHGTLVAECSREGGEKATMILADRPVALPGLGENGRRTWSTVGKNDWLDCTDFGSIHGVPAEKQSDPAPGREAGPEGWNVDYMACAPGDARMMWLNFSQGEPGMNGITVLEDASVPVAVLFNENDSSGEVRPLLDVSVRQDSWADCSYKAGDNFVTGIEYLSDHPLEFGVPEHMDRLDALIAVRDEIFGREGPAGPLPGGKDRELGS